jgi:hypothetical protein
LGQIRIREDTDAGASAADDAGAMNEPTPPIGVPIACLTILSLGVYLFLGALALEWYPLVLVACGCFVAAALPAIKLVKQP